MTQEWFDEMGVTPAMRAEWDAESEARLTAHIAKQKATPLGMGVEANSGGRGYRDVIAVNKDTIAATRIGRKGKSDETLLLTNGGVDFWYLYSWLLRFERWPYEIVVYPHAGAA